jgi:hypothetical protein
MSTSITSLTWFLAASLLGFSTSSLFSNWFKLSRNLFLIPYITLASTFLIMFFFFNKIDCIELLLHNWLLGILAGVIVGLFMLKNVFSQPFSRQSSGWNLQFEIIWIGLFYGIVDALFLNVIPVLMVWQAFPSIGSSELWVDRVSIGTLALISSLSITLFYHLGYPEFRNKSVGLVLVGNMLITLAFLISSNPLGAILSHTTMHIGSVIQGPEKTIQLPPHR